MQQLGQAAEPEPRRQAGSERQPASRARFATEAGQPAIARKPEAERLAAASERQQRRGGSIPVLNVPLQLVESVAVDIGICSKLSLKILSYRKIIGYLVQKLTYRPDFITEFIQADAGRVP